MALSRSVVVALYALQALGALAANPHDALGGYKPVSKVIEHAQIVYDVKVITEAVGSGSFVLAWQIYTGGRHSCKSSGARTLQGFVKQATVNSKLLGQAFYDSFTGGNGPASSTGGPAAAQIPGTGRLSLGQTFWDDFLLGALNGTGDFSTLSETMRKVAVSKGVLGVLTMYTARELESAIKKGMDPLTRGDGDAPHAWDEGWAFFHGSYPTAGKYSAWEFSRKRDLDFAYSGGSTTAARVSGTTEATVDLLAHFLEGLKHSRDATFDMAKLISARNSIYRLFALSAIRAALKYAYKVDQSYSEAYHMEAYAYFLSAAGWVEQAKSGAASTVLSLLDYKKSQGALSSSLYCDVQAALIPAYTYLGLDCNKVGTYKSIPSGFACSSLPSCPNTAALPAGLPNYVAADSTVAKGAAEDCGFLFDEVVASGAVRAAAVAALASAAVASLQWYS